MRSKDARVFVLRYAPVGVKHAPPEHSTPRGSRQMTAGSHLARCSRE